MIPRPRIKLLLDQGTFAPRGRCQSGPAALAPAPHRAPTPATGSPGAAPEADATPANGSITPGAAPDADATPVAYVRPRSVAWAALLRRVFACDVLASPTAAGGCACWRPSRIGPSSKRS